MNLLEGNYNDLEKKNILQKSNQSYHQNVKINDVYYIEQQYDSYNNFQKFFEVQSQDKKKCDSNSNQQKQIKKEKEKEKEKEKKFINKSKQFEPTCSSPYSPFKKTNLWQVNPNNINNMTKILQKKVSKNKHQNHYRVYIGPGNNSQLVRKIILARKSWIQTVEHDTIFNLRWQQKTQKNWYQRIQYKKYKQMVNHLQNHEEITTKDGLLQALSFYLNRQNYANSINNIIGNNNNNNNNNGNSSTKRNDYLSNINKNNSSSSSFNEYINMFCQIVPVSFVLDWDHPQKLQQQLKKFIFYYCQNYPIHLLDSTGTYLKKQRQYIDMVKSISQGSNVKLSNFSFDKLNYKNLNKNQNSSFIPSLSYFNDIYLSPNGRSKYIWILKPSQLNRGRGIKIWSTLQQLKQILFSLLQKQKQKQIQGCYIIQKYIQKPLLISKRKFDIRIWAMIDNQKNFYFFEEGYIRTSCQEYQENLQDLKNIFVHLTNNAIQSKSQKYGMFQSGNQLSYDQFDNIMIKQIMMQTKGDQNQNYNQIENQSQLLNPQIVDQKFKNLLKNSNILPFRQKILPQIKQYTTLTIQSAFKKLFPPNLTNISNNQSKSNSTFQIFGFDYMLDYTGKPWLIQVNTNPCIETSSELLEMLIPRMLDDAFKICLDSVYNPNVYNGNLNGSNGNLLSALPVSSSVSNYPVKGYKDDQNLWKKLNFLKKFNGKDLSK